MKTFALKIAIIENYLLKLTKQVKTVNVKFGRPANRNNH